MRNAVFLAILGISAALYAAVGPDENILLNPGFTSMDRKPQYWDVGKRGDVVFPANALEPGAMPCVTIDGVEGNRGLDLRQYGLRLKAGGRYRLSAKIKGENFSTAGRTGFKVCNYRWKWGAGFDLPKGTFDWTYVEREFVTEPSQGGKYFAVIHTTKPLTGKLLVAEAKLVAVDEETRLATYPSELATIVTMPRLVPWGMFLDEIPAEDQALKFRFFGQLPSGKIGDYRVSVSCCGTVESAPLGEGIIRVPVRVVGKGEATASIVRISDGESVFSRTYRISSVDSLPDPTPGRKLNNLTTEYWNEPLASGASVRKTLVLDKTRWVCLMADAEHVSVDGKKVIGSSTPRHETFRELARGRHEIVVRNAKGGDLIVRAIPELFNYCTNASVVKENPPFDWPFVEKYVLNGVTTLNGGHVDSQDVPYLKERGYIWLGNMNSRNAATDDDICDRLRTSPRINDAHFDGVTCDEQYLNQPDVISHYSASLWKYVHPEGKRVYSWVVGKPGMAGVDHDFVAASVNATEGKGKLLTEYYCVTKRTEEEARRYVTDWLHDSIAGYDAYSAAYRSRYGVIFGNYTQVPNISIWGHAEVDYRYFLDLQFNILANDPAFDGIGCTGVWGSYYADEEVHRWTFMLMRHYFVEGRKDMLSARYGFRYVSGHLVNGDFEKGMEGWSAAGDVSTGFLKDMGSTSEGRRSGNDGCGDTFAILKRTEGSVAKVMQKVTGLTPGKAYCLRYCVLDAKDIAANRRGEVRPYPLAAVLPKGTEVDATLSWSHLDERKTVKNSDTAPRAQTHHVVFKAPAESFELVFTTEAAKPGESLALNCVSVHPYLER